MIRWIVVFLLVAASAQAEIVKISNDLGGNIQDYRLRRAELARAGEVRIYHKCYSACAIYTTLPNACVWPKAQIGFHGASPVYDIPALDMWLDMRMGEFFRGEVQRRYIADWRHLKGAANMHVISGAELHRLDPKVRLCGQK